MKLRIEFDTDNAAFADDFYGELAAVLTRVWDHHKYRDINSGYIRDSNGNRVGQWVHEKV